MQCNKYDNQVTFIEKCFEFLKRLQPILDAAAFCWATDGRQEEENPSHLIKRVYNRGKTSSG